MGRQTIADGAELGGYYWPKETTVMINCDRMHKNPKYWGDDADQFKPERHLKNQMDKIDKYAYIPFGGGIRVCPGRHIAKITLVSSLVNLLRNYDVEYYEKENQLKTYFALVNLVTDFKVILRPKK